MELRRLRYFVVLAETLSFRRAAARLQISQPSLTVGIRDLERELGASLFARSNRGVTLTPAGEAALGYARAALVDAEMVRQSVREWSDLEEGRLTVMFASAAYGLLPRVLQAFRRRHPRAELVVEEASPAEIARRLRLRRADVGLVRLPLADPTHLETAVVAVDELIAAVPDWHPLARERSISLGQLAQESLISYRRDDAVHAVILAACQRAGVTLDVKQEVAQGHTIVTLVQSGLGIGLVARALRYLPDGVKLIPLAERLSIETAMVTPRDTTNGLAISLRALALAELGGRWPRVG